MGECNISDHRHEYFNVFSQIWNMCSQLPNIHPPTDGDDFSHHIFREHNTYADALANKARPSGNVFNFSNRYMTQGCTRAYAQVDGSMNYGVGGA